MKNRRLRDSVVRTALVVYLLARGAKMTTRQVALKTGLTMQGTWFLLNTIASSHDVPITCVDGQWQIIKSDLIDG